MSPDPTEFLAGCDIVARAPISWCLKERRDDRFEAMLVPLPFYVSIGIRFRRGPFEVEVLGPEGKSWRHSHSSSERSRDTDNSSDSNPAKHIMQFWMSLARRGRISRSTFGKITRSVMKVVEGPADLDDTSAFLVCSAIIIDVIENGLTAVELTRSGECLVEHSGEKKGAVSKEEKQALITLSHLVGRDKRARPLSDIFHGGCGLELLLPDAGAGVLCSLIGGIRSDHDLHWSMMSGTVLSYSLPPDKYKLLKATELETFSHARSGKRWRPPNRIDPEFAILDSNHEGPLGRSHLLISEWEGHDTDIVGPNLKPFFYPHLPDFEIDFPDKHHPPPAGPYMPQGVRFSSISDRIQFVGSAAAIGRVSDEIGRGQLGRIIYSSLRDKWQTGGACLLNLERHQPSHVKFQISEDPAAGVDLPQDEEKNGPKEATLVRASPGTRELIVGSAERIVLKEADGSERTVELSRKAFIVLAMLALKMRCDVADGRKTPGELSDDELAVLYASSSKPPRERQHPGESSDAERAHENAKHAYGRLRIQLGENGLLDIIRKRRRTTMLMVQGNQIVFDRAFLDREGDGLLKNFLSLFPKRKKLPPEIVTHLRKQ